MIEFLRRLIQRKSQNATPPPATPDRTQRSTVTLASGLLVTLADWPFDLATIAAEHSIAHAKRRFHQHHHRGNVVDYIPMPAPAAGDATIDYRRALDKLGDQVLQMRSHSAPTYATARTDENEN